MIMKRIGKNVPQPVLLSLYYTLVYPYCSYCNIVWAIDRTSFINNLFISQTS
jgi:hypothetical protein